MLSILLVRFVCSSSRVVGGGDGLIIIAVGCAFSLALEFTVHVTSVVGVRESETGVDLSFARERPISHVGVGVLAPQYEW